MAIKGVRIELLNASDFIGHLRNKLAGAGAQEAYRRVAADSAMNILSRTVVDCPYITGNLRRSYRLFFEDGGMTAGVMTEVDYAPTVELRKPHLIPAFENEKINFISNLREALRTQCS